MENQGQSTAMALVTGEMPNVAYSGINMQNLIDEFDLSKSYVYQYSHDFPQLDTLVDAIPLNPDPNVPFVADTTLPGLVKSIPRQSLQQLPVFQMAVNGSKKTVPALMCTYLLKRYVFNEDTFGKGLLSSLQIGTEDALKHGYAPFMVATGQMFNDFGTTLRLLHFTDTSPEPGIQDHNETAYDYVVSHPTASRIRKILANAQNNPNTVWNVPGLQKLLEMSPKPTNYSRWQSAATQNQAGEMAAPTYELVTRYPVGSPNEQIITFCPEYAEAPLRVLDNHSKFNYPRVQYLVIDPAGLTPFGISRVRLASPNQNLLNIYYGSIAAMLLLNSAPPIFKRGRFSSAVSLTQRAVWETTDPNATAELKTIDNGSLSQFTTIAAFFAGQIQNIMGGQTTSAPAVNKFSKTGPGVKQAQQYLDVNTNQITKILENFLRQYALSAIDTLLSEQIGSDMVIIDDETKDAINLVQPGYVGDDNTVQMNWEEFYAAIKDWSVEIQVSVSKDELDDKKRADLQDMLVVLAQNAQELGPDAVQRVKEITDLLMASKAPLIKPIDPNSPVPMANGVPATKPPSETISYKDVAGSPAGPAMLHQANLPG